MAGKVAKLSSPSTVFPVLTASPSGMAEQQAYLLPYLLQPCKLVQTDINFTNTMGWKLQVLGDTYACCLLSG